MKDIVLVTGASGLVGVPLIEKLLEDKVLWKNLSKEGRNLMKKFSPKMVSNQVVKLLNFK